MAAPRALATLSLQECRQLCSEALRRAGLHAEAAAAIADNITLAERDGCKSHGLFRLPGYCASLQSGKVDGAARPSVSSRAPACVAVDACGGFSTPASLAGRGMLVEKARENGVAAMTISHAFHFAALWPDVEPLAAEHGLVALSFLNSKAFVAHAPGGLHKLYGTNPMAFACPRASAGGGLSSEPFVFDQSSAAIANGEILIAARDGERLPPRCAIDEHGEPTQDAAAALRGAQLPFGGHKGTALALMVELLAASITGDAFAFEARESDTGDGGPTQHGQLILAIDPARCGGRGQDGFLSRVEALLRHVEAEAVEAEAAGREMRMPSQRRFATRRKTPSEGIGVNQELLAECRRLAGVE